MKSAARSASNCDKQNRKERRRARAGGDVPTDERGIFDLASAKEHTDRAGDQGREQEESAQVSARLQQEPHRDDRGEETIYEEKDDPDFLRREVADAEPARKINGDVLAEPDGRADQGQEDQRRRGYI